MKQDEVSPYLGKHVVIHTIDGAWVRGFLQGVGYAGVTLMRGGHRYRGPRLADIVSIRGEGEPGGKA